MDKKENQRVKLTKQLLKSSLIDLLHTKPISKITIKSICENADINRSTFYLYYTSQYALLNEIENELLTKANDHLKKIDSNYSSMQYLEALLSFMEENADIFRTLLCSQENNTFQSTFIKASFENLQQNLPLRCSENISAYVYNFLIMGSFSIIKKWIESGFEVSSKETANLIFHLSNRAITIFSDGQNCSFY